MTTETLTLTDFLLARIAEDEAVARSFTYNWSDPQESLRRRFIADCEAKRRIVERAANWHPGADPFEDGYDTAMEEACKFLALPYADHPDYNPDWRP